MTVIQLQTTQKAPAVSRHCDICGKAFQSKNPAAAQAMLAGKLRVCPACQHRGARTQLPYGEYLNSEWWQQRRAKALAEGGHKCRICAASATLEVHHNTYERLGHERAADLVVLCRKCHQLFHDSGELRY